MSAPISDIDQKWINSLKPYLYGGPVPFFRNSDGSVDASKTIDEIMLMLNVQKPSVDN